MKDIVDLYSRIVIGILGFVAPAITLLIGVFADGIDLHRKKNVAKAKHLDSLMEENHKKIKGESKGKASHLVETNRKHGIQKARVQRDINLLSPKRQVIRVFGSLIFSLSLVMVYDFIALYFKNTTILISQIIILSISLLVFIYSLFCLWQIFSLIIDLKHIDSAQALGKEEVEINQGDFL